jgi:hypothetical protein
MVTQVGSRGSSDGLACTTCAQAHARDFDAETRVFLTTNSTPGRMPFARMVEPSNVGV